MLIYLCVAASSAFDSSETRSIRPGLSFISPAPVIACIAVGVGMFGVTVIGCAGATGAVGETPRADTVLSNHASACASPSFSFILSYVGWPSGRMEVSLAIFSPNLIIQLKVLLK